MIVYLVLCPHSVSWTEDEAVAMRINQEEGGAVIRMKADYYTPYPWGNKKAD